MKILIATDLYAPMGGGVPVSVEQLTKGLLGLGHEVIVIAPSVNFSSYVENIGKLKIYRVGSFSLNRVRKLRFAYKFWQIGSLVGKISPDIVHIESVMAIGFFSTLASKKRKIPIIATNHLMAENLVSAFHFPAFIEKILGKFMMGWAFWLYQKANLLLAPSNLAKQMTIKSGWRGKIEVLSNGVDLEKFEGELESHHEARKKFHLTDEKTVLYVGRLDKEKKVDLLLEACLKLKDTKFQLVLVGEGVEEQALKKQVENLGVGDKVKFLGYVEHEHLMHLFRIADIFVMPSDIELQSISTLEAMANGLPVVACNAGALPELVKDEKNGFLFENNNVEELAKKLEILIGDSKLCEKFGALNRELAYEHSIPNIAKKAVSIYIRFAGNSD